MNEIIMYILPLVLFCGGGGAGGGAGGGITCTLFTAGDAGTLMSNDGGDITCILLWMFQICTGDVLLPKLTLFWTTKHEYKKQEKNYWMQPHTCN